MRLIILGAPGSGKGTQAARIAERLDMLQISTGDLLRAEVKARSEIGRKAGAIMNGGNLVPDDIILHLIEDRIRQDDAINGYIFDGFPRNIEQAKALDRLMGKVKHHIDAVVDLEVPDDVVITRTAGRRVCKACNAVYHVELNPPREEGVCDACGGELIQRDDEKEETVRNRLKVYKEQTAPVRDFYRAKGLLRSFDGTQTMATLTDQIISALDTV
ncbi:adenylate kinase [Candidatus Woesearchaeota archaeon]|nr:adenylate kinase [Candidatus Woesearchaeota archaeon]